MEKENKIKAFQNTKLSRQLHKLQKLDISYIIKHTEGKKQTVYKHLLFERVQFNTLFDFVPTPSIQP